MPTALSEKTLISDNQHLHGSDLTHVVDNPPGYKMKGSIASPHRFRLFLSEIASLVIGIQWKVSVGYPCIYMPLRLLRGIKLSRQ